MTTPPAVDPFQFDYQRHLAAQHLLPQHQDDFQRLIKLLRYAPRFQLLFARIADESYRRLLIGKLQDLLEPAGRPLQTADLSDEHQFPDFAALETWLETAGQGRAVIHLVNTGHWLQGPRVETLNLRRNALAEKLDATLLWWLSADTLARVAREAPDAWSWRGGVFDFIAERPDLAEPVPIRLGISGDIHPLTLAQRSRRLAVLHQQLDGEGSTAIPDVFRLNLLLEQADLYKSLGQWVQAESALRQEALPLAKRLDDPRAQAVTQARIADILKNRGEMDEALRILKQEQIPVYNHLGDERGKAVTQDQIADIIAIRGELDEALRIYRQDTLPVYKRLGDVREQAIAQGRIADILQIRGELDEALRIRTEEELPVYERLGEERGKAVTKSKIADILKARGDLSKALRLLRNEVLPAFKRLGDMHARAIAEGQIADMLEAQNEFDEALALHGQRLPVARQMKDIDGIAQIKFSMARIRLKRHDYKSGGLPIIKEDLTESFSTGLKLDRPDAIGAIGEMLARVLAMDKQNSEALAVLDQAESSYARLSNDQGVARVRALRSAIAGQSGPEREAAPASLAEDQDTC